MAVSAPDIGIHGDPLLCGASHRAFLALSSPSVGAEVQPPDL
jgi:hypothetical protein